MSMVRWEASSVGCVRARLLRTRASSSSMPNRFGDVVVGAGVERLDFGFFLALHREHDDGQSGFRAQLAAQLNAAHVGHGNVSDHQVGLPLSRRSQAAVAIVGGADFVAAAGQGGAQDARDLRLVIHHQDAFLVRHKKSGGLLGDDVDIHGRRVAKKLVDRVQIQISLPAFDRGVAEHDLGDVFLAHEAGDCLGHRG